MFYHLQISPSVKHYQMGMLTEQVFGIYGGLQQCVLKSTLTVVSFILQALNHSFLIFTIDLSGHPPNITTWPGHHC